jgi:hypothetical protein
MSLAGSVDRSLQCVSSDLFSAVSGPLARTIETVKRADLAKGRLSIASVKLTSHCLRWPE